MTRPARMVRRRAAWLGLPAGLTALGLLAAAAADVPRKAQGRVFFRNGDRLPGALLSIDENKNVRWQGDILLSPVEFPLSEVRAIRLPPREQAAMPQPGNCEVRLKYGDTLTGDLVAYDQGTVKLQTWYAGTLNIDAAHVRYLRFQQVGQTLYVGPTGTEGWVITSSDDNPEDPAWGYAQGAFYARKGGGIARDVKLPDRAAIDLDVLWQRYLQLTITIYTSSLKVFRLGRSVIFGGVLAQAEPPPQQEGAGFYAVQFNVSSVYLMTVRKDGQVQNTPLEQVPELTNKNRAHIGIRVDKFRKTISVLVDGRLVKTWEEPEEWAGQGTAIRFVQQGAAPVNLRNIRITEWDGTFPESETPVPTDTGGKDFVVLANHDSFLGTLQWIRDGRAHFAADFGEFTLPVDRLSAVNLASVPQKPFVRSPDIVRAHLMGLGMLTFSLIRWTPDGVDVESPAFGQARFHPEAFVGLDVFHPPAKTSPATQKPAGR